MMPASGKRSFTSFVRPPVTAVPPQSASVPNADSAVTLGSPANQSEPCRIPSGRSQPRLTAATDGIQQGREHRSQNGRGWLLLQAA